MALPFGPIEEIRACNLTVLAVGEISVDFSITDDSGNSATGYFFTDDDFRERFTTDATLPCNAKLRVVTNPFGADARLGIVDLQFGEEWLSAHRHRQNDEVVYNAPSRDLRAYS